MTRDQITRKTAERVGAHLAISSPHSVTMEAPGVYRMAKAILDTVEHVARHRGKDPEAAAVTLDAYLILNDLYLTQENTLQTLQRWLLAQLQQPAESPRDAAPLSTGRNDDSG